jgi:hypothetical protein
MIMKEVEGYEANLVKLVTAIETVQGVITTIMMTKTKQDNKKTV